MESSHATAVLDLFYDVASALPLGWNSPGVWGPQQVAVTVMSLVRPGTTQSYKTCLPLLQTAVGRERWGWRRPPDPRGLSDARLRCGVGPLLVCAHAARDRAVAMAATLVALDSTVVFLSAVATHLGLRQMFDAVRSRRGGSAHVAVSTASLRGQDRVGTANPDFD